VAVHLDEMPGQRFDRGCVVSQDGVDRIAGEAVIDDDDGPMALAKRMDGRMRHGRSKQQQAFASVCPDGWEGRQPDDGLVVDRGEQEVVSALSERTAGTGKHTCAERATPASRVLGVVDDETDGRGPRRGEIAGRPIGEVVELADGGLDPGTCRGRNVSAVVQDP
jgi:hypothetical protein